MQPEDRLVFMHIEKTAGSTAHHVLSQNFEQHEVCPHRFSNLDCYPRDYLACYRFFMLHSHLRIMRTIPKPLKFVFDRGLAITAREGRSGLQSDLAFQSHRIGFHCRG